MRNSFIKTGFWLLLLVAVMGIAVLGCPDAPALPGGAAEEFLSTIIVEIKVIDKKTGEPIADVVIEVNSEIVGNTNSDGSYTLSDVEFGDYTIKVSKEGYNPDTVDVKMEDVEIGGKTLVVTIELDPIVTSVEVKPASVSINVGGTASLTATVTYGNGSTDSDVSWSSSDESVARVLASSDTVVTGVASGSATITATSNKDNTKSASSAVTVIIGVESVIVSPTSVSVDVGKTATLTATVTYSDGIAYSDVSWSSSDTSVATVSSGGVVTGVAPGDTTITATSNRDTNKTATSEVEVIGVISVGVSPASVSIDVGETTTLTISVTYSDGSTDSDVGWSSLDESVATVTSSGVVTGVAPGSVTIAATANRDTGKLATSQVTIVSVTSVGVSPTSVSIGIGATTTLTATVTYSDGSTDSDVSWTSSDTSVVIVSSIGVVTGVAPVSSTITATSNRDNTKSANAVVIVAGVAVTPKIATIGVGKNVTLTAMVVYSDGTTDSDVSWFSSATSVATVSSNGVVTGVATGIATVTAVSNKDNTKSASAEVTVVAVQTVSVTPKTATINVGESVTLTATVIYSDSTTDSDVSWSSSATSVATVSASGVVTGASTGSATIRATSIRDGTKSASAVITVVVVESVAITPGTTTIGVGGIVTLITTVTYSDGSTDGDVSWSSSNNSVVTVSPGGVVAGIVSGDVTITATSNKDTSKSATAAVTVTQYLSITVTVKLDGVVVTSVPAFSTLVYEWDAVPNAAFYDISITGGEFGGFFFFDTFGGDVTSYNYAPPPPPAFGPPPLNEEGEYVVEIIAFDANFDPIGFGEVKFTVTSGVPLPPPDDGGGGLPLPPNGGGF